MPTTKRSSPRPFADKQNNTVLLFDSMQRIMQACKQQVSRSSFLKTLGNEVQQFFSFDRLCINQYNQETGTISFFTAAEGTIISALSNSRTADQETIAGQVIATKKPVIFNNLHEQFHGGTIHSMAEAGLNATIALPLILHDTVIGTLHCSFAKSPDNLPEVADILIELAPLVAMFLGSILSQEQLGEQRIPRPIPAVNPNTNKEYLLFDTKSMREITDLIKYVCNVNVPVFLHGETGTGKTMLARYIHQKSNRNAGNFVKINCPSLVSTLFESELFGHARGAFTGASGKRMGRIEMAHMGTLFLDEIAELTPDMQSKLLQVLEENAFERVGENNPIHADFRLLSATNVNVQEAIENRQLRSDLFYRLAVVSITLPPLNQRQEDIPLLFEYIANKQATTMGIPQISLPASHMKALQDFNWPGNIRELRNVINRLLITRLAHPVSIDDIHSILLSSTLQRQPKLAQNTVLEVTSQNNMALPNNATLSNNVSLANNVSLPNGFAQEAPLLLNQAYQPRTLADIEKEHISRTIKATGGVIGGKKGAAAILGLPRTTLQHKMTKLGINIAQLV